MDRSRISWLDLPAPLRERIEASLQPAERPLAWLALDLDRHLNFATGLLVLTGTRLLVIDPRAEAAVIPDVSSHALSGIHELVAAEQLGAGSLTLLSPGGERTVWRFTAAQSAAAQHLAGLFAELKRRGADAAESNAYGGSATGTGDENDEDAFPRPSVSGSTPASRSFLRLLKFARPWAGMIVLGFLLTVAGTAAGLVPPYLTMPLVDKVLIPFQNGEDVDRSLLMWYLAGLAGAAVLAWLLSWARTYVLAWVSERISGELRNRTYEHLQRLSLTFFGGRRTGDLISRVSSDTDRICYFLSVHLIDFASDVLMIAMTAGILFSIDPLLALITLGPVPVIAWLVQRVRERLRVGFAAGGRAWGEMTSVLADTIPGIRVVKAFAQERREIERFRAANRRVLAANDRVNRTWSFFGPLVVLLTDAGLLVVWAFGAYGVFEHRITVGVLTAFVAYISRFYSRLDSMSRMLAAVQRASASAQRIFEIMDLQPDVAEVPRPIRVGRLEGAIEFRHVSFRYGARQVTQDVCLQIRPGEVVGLVGPSGAGKTTLVNLVCRFYDVTGGAILVDGVDIRQMALEEYRRNIGLVLQEPFLFYGTIAENIAYGRPDADQGDIIAAAKAARAHDFILRLPDGYDSLVGERGQGLSGGERQRISIARALLIDPAILILDEATSSVDTETEREIQLALENLIRGRTTIAIAHRLSTLKKADRLVVLEQGRIVEVGQHADLLKNFGTYARLHQAQFEQGLGSTAAP